MRLADCLQLGPLVEPSDLLGTPLHLGSIAAEARPWVVASAYRDDRGPDQFIVVTPNHERALHWQARLRLLGVPAERLLMLPSGLSTLFEDTAPETLATSDRIGAIRALASGKPVIILATAPSALERTLPLEEIEASSLTIEPRANLAPDEVEAAFLKLGYEPADPVRIPGQVCRRGGLLDVFPMGADRPVRVDWFGDDVESIREFDPMSQRSLGTLESVNVSPSRETLLPTDPGPIIELVAHTLEVEASKLPREADQTLRQLVGADLAALKARRFFDRLDLYRPLIHPESGCALDLLADSGVIVLDEPFELAAVAARAEDELAEALKHRTARGEIVSTTLLDVMAPPERLGHGRILSMNAGDSPPEWVDPGRCIRIGCASLEPLRGQSVALGSAMTNWVASGLSVFVATDQPTRTKLMLSQIELFPSEDGPIRIVEGNLAGGFCAEEAEFAVITDQELFGVGRLRLAQRKFNEGVPITTVLDLKPGDYVVHIHFGIGVYQGLVTRPSEGVEKEYLHIEYQSPDRLFVPADQLDRVQKYLAPQDAPPKVNRLTGGEWQRTVGKARDEAREMARELIRLYAERKKVTRPSFGPDSPEQAEMEHTFPWAETASQLAAIDDVKQDLSVEFPMDRLVCGDVGFGKTEVAIRAAFKVVMAGRQAAVLCPTTILCEQHFRSFSERLAGFSIRVEYLNRFRSASEKAGVKQGLESGDVQLVIGTHGLLAEQMAFKGLGLLVIDEEQKFGVKHKEVLKQLRASVDVLTLSATPIPRTLSMALMSVRPMSLINDPPPGRLPIRTFVRPFGTEVVREALLRELARGGQVYYVYNKVEGIYHVAEKIRKLVPSARIAVGHGQMTEKELEPVMLGFVKGEVDVLVSTTIIESGLDIANSNTLIVENADRFGLATLYQLRGRVGRSDRQAYAYFLYSESKQLTEGALSRLRALQEFSSLGSGYSLAFRDLQIRGAGDILGAKQSGQMSAVGFDLYTQLIDSEVQFLKSFADGDRPNDYADPLAGLKPLPSLDLPVEALIPHTYVADEGQRLFFYKELMSSRELPEIAKLAEEMADRYGPIPDPARRAFDLIACRVRMLPLQIDSVEGRGGRLTISFCQDSDHSPRVFRVIQQRHPEAFLSMDKLIWPFRGDPLSATQEALETLGAAIRTVDEQRAMMSH